MLAQVLALTEPARSPAVHASTQQRRLSNSPPGSFRQELLEHFGVQKQHRGPHILPRRSCCTRQGHLHLFIEQQHYTRPRALDPVPSPATVLLAFQDGLCLQNRTLVGRVSIGLPSKPQVFFISSRDPVWAGREAGSRHRCYF